VAHLLPLGSFKLWQLESTAEYSYASARSIVPPILIQSSPSSEWSAAQVRPYQAHLLANSSTFAVAADYICLWQKQPSHQCRDRYQPYRGQFSM